MCIALNFTGELSAGDTNACCNSDHGCGGSDGCNGGIPEEAWTYFKKVGVVTGGDAGSDASTCYPYPFAACAHHEPSPAFPACPSTEYNTPTCPADNGKGCQAGFAGKWASDKVSRGGGGGYREGGLDS
jgi:cathepsin B